MAIEESTTVRTLSKSKIAKPRAIGGTTAHPSADRRIGDVCALSAPTITDAVPARAGSASGAPPDRLNASLWLSNGNPSRRQCGKTLSLFFSSHSLASCWR